MTASGQLRTSWTRLSPRRAAAPLPFHAAPGSSVHDSPRLLLITFSFPPDGNVGGVRWQEMTRHFIQHGWTVDVLARDFTRGDAVDLTRLGGVAPGVSIYSVPEGEPLIGRVHAALLSAVRWLRRNRAGSARAETGGADARPATAALPVLVRAYLVVVSVRRAAMWARSACRMAVALAGRAPYHAIVTSGPPHVAHLAGRDAAIATGVPLVVDLRDPWSLVERVPERTASALWFWIARRQERSVMRRAAAVTMNTERARDAMRAAYPEFAERIHVVRNGADETARVETARDDVFRIRFAGSIYLDRDPSTFFRAAARVIGQRALTPGEFLIEFAGREDTHARPSVQAMAARAGIPDFVRVHGVLPRPRALEFVAGATMLLSLPQDSTMAIPAKIYEYVRMPAWMLVLATPDSATADLLRGTDALVTDPDDIDAIADAIAHRLDAFRGGARPLPVGRDGRFDRRHQSARMLELVHAASGRT